MIDEIIADKRIGKLSNLITLHSERLGIRKDSAGIYDLAKEVLNRPKDFKPLLDKLKEYED